VPDVPVEWDEVAELRAANVRLRQVIEARDAEIARLSRAVRVSGVILAQDRAQSARARWG